MIEYLKLTRYVWVGPAVMWVACCAMSVHAFGLVGLIHPVCICGFGVLACSVGLSLQEFTEEIGGGIDCYPSYLKAINISSAVAYPLGHSVFVTFLCYVAWWSQIVSV